jgi:glycerate 2-kinase
MTVETRKNLERLLDVAIAAAQPANVVPPALPELPKAGRVIVLGAGKAAAAMAIAVEDHYRDLDAQGRLAGMVATRHGYGLPTRTIRLLEAGHPVPDVASAEAAEAALALAATAGPEDIVLVLMSGGASAIWCAPVAGLTLDDKQATTKALLKSGERIHEMNCVRKHLSLIKGGRLARAANGARLITLAIADVPGDDPAVIGSGPTVADPTTLAEARAIVARLRHPIPASVLAALADPRNETLKAGDPAFAKAEFRMVAAPSMSLAAAKAEAERLGYRVEVLGDALEGEARDVARAHAERAVAARKAGQRIALLSGGELTVTVKGTGIGGPNQEYALALAIALNGAPSIAAIAADTDGTDGGVGAADDPAGAIVMPDTLARAQDAGFGAPAHLSNNDSTPFFKALGDLVIKGPTQTNVNDFRAILIDP